MTIEADGIPASVSVAPNAHLLIIRGAVSLILRVGGVALAYASSIFLSRLLGLHDYGLYVILMGWVSVLSVPTRLGFDASIIRYGTIYREEGDWPALRGLVSVATLAVGGAAVILSVGMLLLGARFGADAVDLVSAATLLVATSMLGLYAVCILSAGSVFGSQFYDQLLRPALLILSLGAATLFGKAKLTVGAALGISAAVAWLALGGLMIHLAKRLRACFGMSSDYAALRNWIWVSLPLWLITGIQELLNQIQVILLGALADARAAGLFAAAWRLSSLISFGLVALSSISGPLIASAFHRANFGELGRLTNLAARIALAFAVPAAIGMAFAGPLLLALFGDEFRAAYPTLLVLVGGALVNAFTGVVAYLLTLTGRERHALIILTAALAINILLNVLLIPPFGALGAAIASATSTIVWNLAMLTYVWRLMGIDASALGRSKIRR